MFKYKLYVKYVLDAVRCLNFRLIVVCLLFGRDRRFRTSNMAALIARSTVSSLTRRGIATSTLRCADKMMADHVTGLEKRELEALQSGRDVSRTHQH